MRSQGEGKRTGVIGGPCFTRTRRLGTSERIHPQSGLAVETAGVDVSVATREGGDVLGERAALSGPEKARTGITGFDEITGGGLPRGRPTLVTGAAGSGKTLFGIEFLVRGARDYGEPGVLLAFEEAQSDLATNVASLGFDLEPAREGRPARDRRLPAGPRRDHRDRRLRPRGPVHPAGHGRRVRGRQAGVPGHHRAALQRAAQRGHHPRRARSAVPLAQGARPDGRDQR